MSKYRILEKKGRYEDAGFFCQDKDCRGKNDCLYDHIYKNNLRDINKDGQIYVPRFIVQKLTIIPGNGNMLDTRNCCDKMIYEDLKEFTSLADARSYKYDLDLEEGIIRE